MLDKIAIEIIVIFSTHLVVFAIILFLSSIIAKKYAKSTRLKVIIYSIPFVFSLLPFVIHSPSHDKKTLNYEKNTEKDREEEYRHANNSLHLSKLCKNRKRTVRGIGQKTQSGLAIFYESSKKPDINFNRLVAKLTHGNNSCEFTALTFLEFKEYKKNNFDYKEEGLFEQKHLCDNPDKYIQKSSTARYELVFGDSIVTSTPWKGEVSSVSVRIQDRTTGELVAEDTLYSLGRTSEVGVCPSHQSQLVQLITDVFGP
ncbi:hypothetical protein [Viridibacterium curvum]|uniref:Uncharacterized protein n=1 Tax=Viridibacterium curvum TaxID=1101404 RepID=A0ABP9QCE5_9RHOO